MGHVAGTEHVMHVCVSWFNMLGHWFRMGGLVAGGGHWDVW